MRRSLLLVALLAPALAGCDLLTGHRDRAYVVPPAVPVGTVVASGAFADKGGQHTTGTYRIEQRAAGLVLVLEAGFKTDEGPDLHVLLSPTDLETVGNRSANVDGAHVVAPLARLEGAQEYALPAGFSLDGFETVCIHCVRYVHLFGAARLR